MNGIKAIRTQLGMSQKAFADGLGQTQGNVWQYESRGQTVPPDVARKVIDLVKSKGYGCSFDDVYSESPKLRRSRSAKAEA